MASGERDRYEGMLHDWTNAESIRQFEAQLHRSRRRRRLIWTSLGLAVLITSGVVAYVGVPLHWYNKSAYETRYAVGPHQNEVPGAVRSDLARTISTLEQFVEQQRSGTYARSVVVAPVSDRDFLTALQRDRADVAVDEAALALEPSQSTVNGSEIDQDGITGFYDSEDNVLYVRGHSIDQNTRITLVHALTHAYDDQRVAPTAPSSDSDSATARQALAEGDAAAVQAAYLAPLTVDVRCPLLTALYQPDPADCLAADYEQRGTTSDSETESQFLYALGRRFVQYLNEHGGQRAVDQAFARPPTATFQLIEPDAYVSGVRASTVDFPVPTQGRDVRRLHLGALRVSALVSAGRLGPGVAGYLLGWRGDSAVSYEQRGLHCMTDRVHMADGPSAHRLVVRLTAWKSAQTRRSFERMSPTDVAFTSCTA